ncbi:hypothetical protein Y695_02271 [Hydrogenophaga sp. T4]|nr:hypothetical protein Y695_02271 [Hydrogenophaga sp. T4]
MNWQQSHSAKQPLAGSACPASDRPRYASGGSSIFRRLSSVTPRSPNFFFHGYSLPRTRRSGGTHQLPACLTQPTAARRRSVPPKISTSSLLLLTPLRACRKEHPRYVPTQPQPPRAQGSNQSNFCHQLDRGIRHVEIHPQVTGPAPDNPGCALHNSAHLRGHLPGESHALVDRNFCSSQAVAAAGNLCLRHSGGCGCRLVQLGSCGPDQPNPRRKRGQGRSHPR